MGDSEELNGVARRAFLRSSAVLAGALAPGLVSGQAGSEEEHAHGAITDVGGVRVGHFTDARRPTGCTVALFERGAVAGVDVRGSAPGTRETDLLNPINTVQTVNAILLTGGSAYGLDAATGVMQYCEEHHMGFFVGVGVVPIVPAAVLIDLQIGDPKVRPDARAGYAACEAATNSPPAEGNVGAGAGATVGKLFGYKLAMKGGFGTASIRIGDTGLVVGAMAAVNAVGDVIDHRTGKILAGARSEGGQSFANTMRQITEGNTPATRIGAHTTLGLVATNATLTKAECTKVAQMAHDGFARTINPTHTAYDGDTIFAAATGEVRGKAEVSIIGAIAAEAMARAVNRAVLTATGIPGYPAHRDMPGAAG
ncbi:MAG TPA: P1 family peptidase [Bryobacteraceae bacterium]|nr:P1 family peptidase [Bryobacteraceae bacterium]